MSIIDLNNINNDKQVEESNPVDNSIKDIEKEDNGLKEVTSNEPSDIKTVIMDGPLSRVYSQALNMVLSNESSAAASDTDVLVVFDEAAEKNEVSDKESLYVYCCDAGDIDHNDVVDGFDKLRLALDNNKPENVMMVMESHDSIKKPGVILEEYAYKSKVKVFFDKGMALEAIKDQLSKRNK